MTTAKKMTVTELRNLLVMRGNSIRNKDIVLKRLDKSSFSIRDIKDRSLKRQLIKEFMFIDINKERACRWVKKIADEDWENLFDLPGRKNDLRVVSFSELFERTVQVDKNRNKSINAALSGSMGENTAPLKEAYQSLGTALHKLRTKYPLDARKITGEINASLFECLERYREEIEAVYCNTPGRILRDLHLFKAGWLGGKDIVSMLLASTPSVASFSAEQLIRPETRPFISLFSGSLWNLACEAADHLNIPEKLLSDYRVMNAPGIRKPLSGHSGTGVTHWKGYRFGYFSDQGTWVTPSRIMAENLDAVKKGLVPDEVLFTPYSYNNYVPAIVFTAFQAFSTLDDASFDEYMKETVIPILSRFEGFFSRWKESEEYRRLGTNFQWMYTGYTDKDDPFQQTGLRSSYIAGVQAYIPVPSETRKTAGDIDPRFKFLTDWTGAKLAGLIMDLTDWYPSETDVLEKHREWVDALFEELCLVREPNSRDRIEDLAGKIAPDRELVAIQDLKKINNGTIAAYYVAARRPDLWVPEGEKLCSVSGGTPEFSETFVRRLVHYFAILSGDEKDNEIPGFLMCMRDRLLERTLRIAREETEGAFLHDEGIRRLREQFRDVLGRMLDGESRDETAGQSAIDLLFPVKPVVRGKVYTEEYYDVLQELSDLKFFNDTAVNALKKLRETGEYSTGHTVFDEIALYDGEQEASFEEDDPLSDLEFPAFL